MPSICFPSLSRMFMKFICTVAYISSSLLFICEQHFIVWFYQNFCYPPMEKFAQMKFSKDLFFLNVKSKLHFFKKMYSKSSKIPIFQNLLLVVKYTKSLRAHCQPLSQVIHIFFLNKDFTAVSLPCTPPHYPHPHKKKPIRFSEKFWYIPVFCLEFLTPVLVFVMKHLMTDTSAIILKRC